MTVGASGEVAGGPGGQEGGPMPGRRAGSVSIDLIVFVASCAALLALAALTDRLVPEASPERTNLKAPPLDGRDRTYGVAAPQPDVLWLAGSAGKIVRSDDAGATWAVQQTPLGEDLQDIAAWDGKRAVAVGNDGVAVVTADGGASWRRVDVPRSEVANKLLRVRLAPDGSAWAVGAMGTILRSADGGATWERRGREMDVAWNDIAFPDKDRGVVVGEFGRVMRTADGGRTWKETPRVTESSLLGVAFRDGKLGVAVGLDGRILATRDGGATWSPAAAATREHLLAVGFVDGGWVAVGDMGMLFTADPEARQWSVRRLAEHEIAWHTDFARYSGGLFLVGASRGTWRAGAWSPLILK